VQCEVVIEFDPQTNSFCATVPGLPVIVDADSEEEALQMAREAIEFCFEDNHERRDVPHSERPGYAKVVKVEVNVPSSR